MCVCVCVGGGGGGGGGVYAWTRAMNQEPIFDHTRFMVICVSFSIGFLIIME